MAVRVICKNIGFRFLMKQYPLICLRVQSAAGSVLKYYKRATIILPIEAEMATKAEIQSVIDPLLRKNSLKKVMQCRNIIPCLSCSGNSIQLYPYCGRCRHTISFNMFTFTGHQKKISRWFAQAERKNYLIGPSYWQKCSLQAILKPFFTKYTPAMSLVPDEFSCCPQLW